MSSQQELEEQEALEQAIAASLVTEKEDAERRRCRYSNTVETPVPSLLGDIDFSLPSGLGLDQRNENPQPPRSPGGTNASGSFARPRPTAGMDVGGGINLLGPPPPVPRQRPIPSSFTGSSASLNVASRVPPPLPSVGPNQHSMGIQPPLSHSSQMSLPPPPGAARSRSVPPPMDRGARPKPVNTDVAAAHIGADLITLSPPTRSNNAPFDFSDLDPLTNPNAAPVAPVSSTLVAKHKVELPQVPAPSLQPMNLFATGKTSIPNTVSQYATITRPRSSSELMKSADKSMWESSLPRKTSHPAMPAPIAEPVAFDPFSPPPKPSSAKANSLAPATSIARSTTPTSGDGASALYECASEDLMDFGAEAQNDENEYLSLQYFDPLYIMENSGNSPYHDKITKSSQLFPEPEKRKQPMYTMTPQKQTDTESSEIREAADGTSDESEPSRTRTESEGELQDPFSFSDLVYSLEKKRKAHAEEQEEKQTILRRKSVDKEDPAPQADTRNRKLSRGSSYIAKGQESSYEMLQEYSQTADAEIQGFCQMVARTKSKFKHDDPISNLGLAVSSMNSHAPRRDMTVKVTVSGRFMAEPVSFTPSLSSAVEHILSYVLLSLTENLGSTSTDNYILKVFGLSEFLLNQTILGDYEYVQQCLKMNDDIKLTLVDMSHVNKPFKRTERDDMYEVFVPKSREIESHEAKVTRDKLNILMETFYKEVEKLRDQMIQNLSHGVISCKGVVQSVKAVCAVLFKMEFLDVIKAVQKLQAVTKACASPAASHSKRESSVYETSRGDNAGAMDEATLMVDLHLALEDVTKAVKCMIEIFCRTFHTDFRFESATHVSKDTKELESCAENLIVHVASIHRVPLKMRSVYEEYKVICGLYYGGKKLAPEVMTSSRTQLSEGFQESLVIDEWLQFDSVSVNRLPRESRLCFTLIGIKSVQATTSDGSHRVTNAVGWTAMQVFNHKFELVQGSQLLGLWFGDQANPNGTSISNVDNPNSILLQVNLPEFDCDIAFPGVPDPLENRGQDFNALHPSDQETIQDILDKDSITRLTPEQYEMIWEKRHFLYAKPKALAKVILAAPDWTWCSLRSTYTMIQHWSRPSPIESFELLQPKYPDTFVRNRAVELMGELNDDQFCDILPQLIQAMKFESYHTSALARIMLERAVTNVRIAHRIYWLLKDAAEDVRFRKRYELMFGALLSVVGAKMRQEFAKQEELVKMLYSIAEKVKAAKDREGVLMRELSNMWEFYQHDSVRLPLSPGMEIIGLDVKSCSYFNSFTVPLKLVLVNVDSSAEPLYTMFKVGDDLRQDMITMQFISIMDKLWLRDGLDLKMITFKCQPTGPKRGLVEIVTESETLRKIQVKHGVAGSFKDRPIAEWLQIQNPTELEYEKAVSNFTASCAGYCVATYVLGIGDRHNDNIMVKQTGHLFHIDFAKFLGDSQKFGNFKRDRVPFVLTSDMAYVINGGDKPSHRFQHFVDLCCQAFNIIRKHSNLFLNLFSMMTLSGIPGVTEDAAKYVQKVLLPEQTDAEATATFTRMMTKSLKSSFTQINFFIHNLAQLKFSGHNEGALLSFIPKTYSLNTDGKISDVEIYGFQKRYNPEKYYIYIIKVHRDKQKVPTFIFRRYSEFQEFHHKLVLTFPLVKLPSLTNKVILGRTHVKTVAETRKAELECFLQELIKLATEISEHDLVYTFFHPVLRDEQDIDKTNLQKLREPTSPRVKDPTINGQIKLSLRYANGTFTVMVMHVKDLSCTSDGEAPDPYVKLYLLPDPSKLTKRKTKIATKTYHPTYNEMLTYRQPLSDLKMRMLQVTVWNYDALKENEFLGAVHIKLDEYDLGVEHVHWYRLQNLHQITTR